MICKVCKQDHKIKFRDKIRVCENCRQSIYECLPTEFQTDESLDEWFVHSGLTTVDFLDNGKSAFLILKEPNGLQFPYYRCHLCGKWLKASTDHPFRPSEKVKQGAEIFCSRACQLQSVREKSVCSGVCVRCGKFVKRRDVARFGIECGCSKGHARSLNYMNSAPGNCVKCGSWQEKRTTAGLGIECGCAAKLAFEIRPDNSVAGKCTVCGQFCEHRNAAGMGVECGCTTRHGEQIRPDKPGKCIWCGVECERRSAAGLGVECGCAAELALKIRPDNSLPGYCGKCGKWYEVRSIFGYCTSCNIGMGGTPNFIIKDGIEFCLDHRINQYVPWEQMKMNVTMRQDSILSQTLMDHYDATWVPTYISEDSTGQCGHATFDRELLDRSIGWFVYIKFYIDQDGLIRPLVAGKSGSLVVNAAGSDLSFSMDPEDGPARRFLIENDLHWYYEAVLVIPTDDRNSALSVEAKLQNDYGLFGS